MRVLIQKIETQKFFTSGETWTHLVVDAHVFSSTREATLFALEKNLKNVQIILRFDQDGLDLRLPIHD